MQSVPRNSRIAAAFSMPCAICLLVWATGRIPAQTPKGSDQVGPQVLKDGFAEAKLEREVKDRINRIAKMDIDGLCDALTELGEDYNVTYATRWPSGFSKLQQTTCTMFSSFADRRVARLYSLLKALPRDEARRKCEQQFDAKLKMLRETWTGNCRVKYDPNAEPPAARVDVHAVRSLALMCALFCEPKIVVAKLDNWKAVMNVYKAQALLFPDRDGLLSWIDAYGDADNLFVTHLLMITLQRQGRFDKDLVNRSQELGLPALMVVNLTAWDAQSNGLETLAAVNRQPGDKDKLLETFSLSEAWGGDTYYSLDAQDRIVAFLRHAILRKDGEPLDPQPTPAVPQK